ncbi:hypothetical protein, partial [Maribellus sediminis]|uniref:hypothetical protein n=1 Tax=Maribellus sediminis TaxID=2696285 RepID=UPI00143001FF
MKEIYCKSKRWRTHLLLLFSAVMMSVVSFAQTPPCVDGVSNDWGDGGYMAGQSTYELNHDVFIGNNDDIFTGGKDFKDWGMPSPTPDYSNWTFSPMQAKSDIMNASAAIVTGLRPTDGCPFGDPLNPTYYDPTHTYLFFAGDRESNKGTGYIGFWFCLNGTEPVDIGGDKYFYPEHAIGDILILANFENGGRIADVTVLKWVGPGNGTEGNNLSLVPLDLNSQVGTNNDTPTPVPPGWITDGRTEYDYFEFFEGIVDLTPIFAEVNDPQLLCKATWMLETRSSKEITADSKDFVGGNFNIAPVVEVSDDAVCENGSASLTATLKDANGDPVSPAGYTFTWSPSGSYSGQGTSTISFASAQLGDAGDYIVTVTSETECEPNEPDTATLTVYDNPTCTVTTTDQSNFYAADGTAKVTVNGADGDTYYWTDGDGNAIPEANGQGTDSIWGLSMGRYYVHVTDVNGCETSCNDSLGWAPTAPTCSVTAVDVECYGAETGMAWAQVIPSGPDSFPPFTYIWLKDLVPFDTIVSTSMTDTMYNLGAGIYDVYIKNSADPNYTQCWDTVFQPDPNPVMVECSNITMDACLGQSAIDIAFGNWLDTVFMVSGGTDPLDMVYKINDVEIDIDTLSAPDACGGFVTVEMVVTDYCGTSDSCSATFTVTDAPAIEATPPADLTLGSCLTQDSVNTAYDAWVASGVVTGGCGLVVDIVKPDAPDACGGSVDVMWIVSSDCADTIRATRTFTVTDAPAIEATPPADLTLGSCLTQDSVNTAYDAWVASGVVTGGCGLVVDIVKPDAPDACGGSVDVMWIVSSDCADTIRATRTFTVTDAPAI